ncbi:MAG: GIY-YIG nuclease family protein [Elusimicrobia bacterium]|nr:GIY-YIG nuclease family protein [Elusimicrobiota bacterium]
MNKKFPQSPGVYIMRGAGGDIIYIGKAANLSKRVGQYFQGSRKDFKLSALLGLLKRIDYIVCESERDALILEDRLIKKHQPFFNIDLKDGKSYARVKITDEDFPRILMVRSKIAGGGRYFGPYPKSSQVKSLLRYLWQSKLLPLRPCRWEFSIRKPLAQKKINSCVYFHTGQCPAPCAGKISFKNYRKIVRRAVMFFEGKFSKLEREFFTLMKKSSAKMDYEASAQYRNFIDGLKHIGERIKVSRYKDE